MIDKNQLSLEQALVPVRRQIDELDTQLLDWLVKRIELIKCVGKIKKEYSAPALSQSREDEVLARVENEAMKRGIPTLLIRDIWKAIFKTAYIVEENHDK